MAGETSFGYVPETTSEPTVPESPSVITDKVHPADEMPPSLYLEAHKVPLVLELIGGTSAYRQFDMELLTRETDRYINTQVKREGLEDNKESYQSVLNDAMDRLKLTEGTDVYAMVEKLVRHFRIQEKLYSAQREREELDAADPMELSAAKLKLYLERHHGLKQTSTRY